MSEPAVSSKLPEPTEGSSAPQTDDEDPDRKRNLTLLTLDGTFFAAGGAFYDSSTVLPAFVSTLTDSKVLIGLAATIRTAGWFLPQLAVARFTEGLRYKKRLVIINSLLQRLALVLMAAVTYLYAVEDPELALVLFFSIFVVSSVSEGINGVPWTDVVANTIPANRRGRLFGNQQIFGGFLALLAGLLVSLILRTAPYPDSYVILFLCTCAGFLLSILSFMGVREKPSIHLPKRKRLLDYFRSLPDAWRGNPDFARVMKVRFCLAFIYLSQPFFVVHARQNLGMGIGSVGLFVSAQMLGLLAGSALGGHMNDRRGTRTVVILSMATATLAPAMALMVTALAWLGAAGWASTLFYLVYFFMGSTFGTGYIGFTNYVLEVAPAPERPTFIGLSNTLMAPFAFLSTAGGALASYVGYEGVFALSTVVAALGLVLARGLREPGELAAPEGSMRKPSSTVVTSNSEPEPDGTRKVKRDTGGKMPRDAQEVTTGR